jgi:hypothetical protein
MPKTGSERSIRLALKGLEAGNAEEVDRLLASVDDAVIAEAFADLVEGNARPDAVVASFVAACWEEGRAHAADRRAQGKRTPASPSDVPREPSARRRYLALSVDAVPGKRLVDLFIRAAVTADREARERAAGRIVAEAPFGRGPEVTGPESELADQWLRGLGALRPLDRLRLAGKLVTTLTAEIERTAVEARAKGATWREIGAAQGIGPDAARKRLQ